MNRFKNLEIWKRAIILTTRIYNVTSSFPEEEKYGLIMQLRRCAVSIGSNIVEGAGRRSGREFRNFLDIAYGSSCELETQLIIAQNLDFLNDSISTELFEKIHELQKMIYVFVRKLTLNS